MLEYVLRGFEEEKLREAYLIKGESKNALYEKIMAGKEKIALVGLGYVGMPIAVAFAKKVKVIGFDLNTERLNCISKALI